MFSIVYHQRKRAHASKDCWGAFQSYNPKSCPENDSPIPFALIACENTGRGAGAFLALTSVISLMFAKKFYHGEYFSKIQGRGRAKIYPFLFALSGCMIDYNAAS
jgi:hypothetical protein